MFIHPHRALSAELSHSSPRRARRRIAELPRPRPKPTPKPSPTCPILVARHPLHSGHCQSRRRIAYIPSVVSKHQQKTNTQRFTYHRRSWRRIKCCLRLNAKASTSYPSISVSRTQDASDHPIMHTARQTTLSSSTSVQPFIISSFPTTFINSPARAKRARA